MQLEMELEMVENSTGNGRWKMEMVEPLSFSFHVQNPFSPSNSTKNRSSSNSCFGFLVGDFWPQLSDQQTAAVD